jgi:hypothetical protein
VSLFHLGDSRALALQTEGNGEHFSMLSIRSENFDAKLAFSPFEMGEKRAIRRKKYLGREPFT